MACRKRYDRELAKPHGLLPVGKVDVGNAVIEARKGKPGHGTILGSKQRQGKLEGGGGLLSKGKPAGCPWGVLSGIVLGACESHVHGEGADGSTQPAKETCAGQVGPEQCKPTSLRGIANKAKAVGLARKRVQPKNPALAGENCMSGSVRGAPGNRRPYRGDGPDGLG